MGYNVVAGNTVYLHSFSLVVVASTFDEDKNDFYIFVPTDLDLSPLDRKYSPLVTLLQRRFL